MHNTDIWLDMLIKFSKHIGNSFAKIINTKVNSKPSQTAEMELFPQVVTSIRDELRILSRSKMKLFAKIVENENFKTHRFMFHVVTSRVLFVYLTPAFSRGVFKTLSNI